MSDLLSIAASVTGLLGTSAKVLKMLYDLRRNAKDAPESIRRVIDEVQEMNLVFGQVQVFVSGAVTADSGRLTMIFVHHLVATLTGFVMVYSNLNRKIEEVAGLAADYNVAMNKTKLVGSESKGPSGRSRKLRVLSRNFSGIR
jgi:hypothetical protein